MFAELKQMDPRQIALQALNIMTIGFSALMIWKALVLALNNKSPIVVMLNESMDPAFHRGDLLVISLQSNDPIQINDICVFTLPKHSVPIVHRVIKLHDETATGKQYLLTKGDSDYGDDRSLYDSYQMWIHQENVIGKVKGFVPYIGMITIVMIDYPYLKYVFLAAFGFFALVQRV